MIEKKLKYRQYLEGFPNCPPSNFKEIERSAYRWIHNPLSTNDFKPVNLITEPPTRMLDESDKMCMAYGLSMFDTLENSVAKYQKIYNKIRLHQREQFREDKGDYIVLLTLTALDGIVDAPNITNYGHFTFHGYQETNLEEKMSNLFNIFNENGEFNV